MSFKKKSKQMTFAALESVENNSFTNIRLKRMVEIDNSIDWCSIKKIFDLTYNEGKNKHGQRQNVKIQRGGLFSFGAIWRGRSFSIGKIKDEN